MVNELGLILMWINKSLFPKNITFLLSLYRDEVSDK